MSKFLYPIYKLNIESYKKWWLYHKKAGGSGILSEILEGFSFNLENTLNRKFKLFDVEGNTRQSNLPAEYTQLDYIKSDGKAFIDTGIILGKNYKVDVDFVNNVVKNYEQPIVSIWTTSSNWWNLFINSSGVLDFYAKGHNYLGEVAIGEKQKVNIIRDNNKITVIKNGESFPISVKDTEVNNTTLKLFKRGDNQGDSRISILATSVYDNNILVRNFIPCKNSNNVIGMYDLVTKTFFANAGTGSFTAGDVSLPTSENPILIKNTGDSGSINEKITNSDGTKEQDYSIFVQQPMRSIGDVRDCFVKKSDGWYERHLPYIANYNGETLPQDVYNEVDNVKYCNEKSMSTTGQFSIGASVQYIDENNWNDLPCTETQIQQLENLPSTYKDFTIIQSEDETPAHLKIQYYKEG